MVRKVIKSILPPQSKTKHDPRVNAILHEVEGAESILDIGCVQHDAEEESDAFWLHSELYDITDDVTGLDYLEEEVQKLNEKGYNVICENAEDFDLGREFDVIIGGEIIEHLSNPGLFLENVHDHLEDDGRFVLSTPNPFCLYRILDSIHGGVTVNPEHTCYFDKTTIRQILNRHNFEIVNFQFIPSPLYSPIHSHMNILYIIHGILYRIGLTSWGSLSMVITAKRRKDTQQ